MCRSLCNINQPCAGFTVGADDKSISFCELLSGGWPAHFAGADPGTLRRAVRCPEGNDPSGQPSRKKCTDQRNPPLFMASTGLPPAAYSYGPDQWLQCVTRAPRCTLHSAAPPAAIAPSAVDIQPAGDSADAGSAPSNGSAECWRGAAFATPAGGSSGRCAGRASPRRPGEPRSADLAALSGAMVPAAGTCSCKPVYLTEPIHSY
eukprot:gene12931-biopygen1398